MKKLTTLVHLSYNGLENNQPLQIEIINENDLIEFYEILKSVNINASDYIDKSSFKGYVFSIPFKIIEPYVKLLF